MSRNPTNIAFIGGRGAGKSKISRKFGKQSGRPVFSIDTIIAYEAGGITIENLVDQHGWQAFRDWEFRILQKLCAMKDIVIDCGGGILVEAPGFDPQKKTEVYSERKAGLLRECSTVIYVERGMDWLLNKVTLDSERPDLEGEYTEVLRRRLPWYERVADLTLHMDELGLKEAMRILREKFEDVG